ncbi:cell wall hydrolase [Polymorphobacter sp.]|uniref:cell wall hydrolase n=1 Tax=Polymorphobacter sp. TaxID=1909290 RepID=UPI003F7169B8
MRISESSRRLILAMASSLFLLAAGSVPTTYSLDSVSEEMLQSAPVPAEQPITAADLDIMSLADVPVPDYDVAPAALITVVNAVDAPAVEFSEDDERLCLARAVYFEARGEPLEGQLAVAQAIINRTESGRYPSSICGVIRQPGQFTYPHGSAVRAGAAWHTAKAIALVAVQRLWPEVAPDAISFHATHVRPVWRDKVRIAQIGRHVFYR